MVVSKTKFGLILSGLIFLTSCSAQLESKDSNKDVIGFLQKNIAESTAKLGHRIELCEKQRQESNVVLLNTDILKKIKAKNNNIIIALTYASFNNTFKCESKARMQLAYDLGLLASVKRKQKLNVNEIVEIEDNLIYPSIKQIRLELKYLKLPSELKKYISETVGKKPFNLIESLKRNKLLKF